MPHRRSVRHLVALLILASIAALPGCMYIPAEPAQPVPAAESVDTMPSTDAWVVVMFEERPAEFDTNLMELLFETELKADEALGEAGAGWIDGNDVGAFGYELYFVGDDVDEMWEVLEPVFEDAPVAWTRVELRNSLEDPAPRVLTQE